MIITPYSEKHAIKNVLFAFEFSNPLPPSILKELQAGDEHDRLKKTLPKFQQLESISIELKEPSPGTERVHVKDVGGFSFEALQPNGEMSWVINIQPHGFFVSCGEYQRWVPTWANAKMYLEILLPWVLKHTQIRVIALQYVDEFNVTDNPLHAPLSELFDTNSKYVPGNIAELKGSFHSHHGFFVNIQEPAEHRKLCNINVSVVNSEDGESSTATIQTVHKFMMNDPIIGTADILLAEGGVISRTLDELHKDNKTVVGDLLTQEAKSKINFNDNQD